MAARSASGSPAPFLAIAGLTVYANSLAGVFVFDDTEQIVENFAIRQGWPPGRLGPRFPLSTSLAMNYALGGLEPAGYHAFNIAVHLGAGLALFGLVRRTLRLPSLGNHFARSADGMALAVALVWIVHPLQTQAVTYIVQRCEAMMGLFFLLTLYSYVRARLRCGPGAEILVRNQFPDVLPGVAQQGSHGDRAARAVAVRPPLSGRQLARNRTPARLAALGLRHAAGRGVGGADSSGVCRELDGRIWNPGGDALEVCPQPAGRHSALPAAERLAVSAVPGLRLADRNTVAGRDCAAGLAVLGLLAASVVAMLRGRRIGFLGIAFFLILAPTSSIVPIQDLCFEHRMYLPLACVVTACVLADMRLSSDCPGRRPASAVLPCCSAWSLCWAA